MERLVNYLQNIDRRILYVILAVIIAVPLIKPFHFALFINDDTKAVFQSIEAVPADKVILLAAEWEAGTKGELAPQTAAIVDHMFKSGKKFAIISTNPTGPRLAEGIVEAAALRYGKKYGQDWVNWGYKGAGNMVLMMQTLVNNIPKAIESDIHGTPVDKIPVMAGLKDMRQMGMVVLITGFVSVPENWVQYVHGPAGVPMALGCTAVSAPQYYPYVDSKQFTGMIVGMRGASEYENLAGIPLENAKATQMMSAQSLAHVYVIILIILGNAILLYNLRKKRRLGNA